MTDPRPDLTTTEMRQGNSRKMNLRVLVIGIVVVIIGLSGAVWYNASVSPDTETTTSAGETLETQPPAEGEVDSNLENLPTPAPVNQ